MTVQDTLWVEKHRPQTLDEIIGHKQVIDRLKKYVGDDEIPHMIFSGPAGVGKTATVKAFARDQFGDEWAQNLTELNASDERGIDTVRDTIKGVARRSPAGSASFKIIFLDEADQLSHDAQPALRRIMEDYSDVTRFFLSCNYINQIIDPLQSRCSVFRFGSLGDEEMGTLIDRVAKAEGLEVESFAKSAIIRECRGDARSVINSLQTSAVGGKVTEESIKTVVGVVDDRDVRSIVDRAIQGDLEDAMDDLDAMLKDGASVNTLADSFLRILKSKNMPEPGKIKCIDKLAECEWRVKRGANPHIQFHSLLADLRVGYHLDFNKYEP